MRKKPLQTRSQSMVQRLVDATAITIAEQGLDAATAARIAEKAGVSVGSLYQYFNRKEDLYAAVLQRITIDLKAIVSRHIEKLPDRGIQDFVRGLLQDVWAFLEANEQRYLQITRYWAQLDFIASMNELETQMTTAMAVYVMHHPPSRRVDDLPAKVYILVNSVLFTIVKYISDPAPHISRQQVIESFAQTAALLMNEDATTASRKRRR